MLQEQGQTEMENWRTAHLHPKQKQKGCSNMLNRGTLRQQKARKSDGRCAAAVDEREILIKSSGTSSQQQCIVELFLLRSADLEEGTHGREDVLRDLTFEAPGKLLHRRLCDFLAVLDDAKALADSCFRGRSDRSRLAPSLEPVAVAPDRKTHGAGDTHAS